MDRVVSFEPFWSDIRSTLPVAPEIQSRQPWEISRQSVIPCGDEAEILLVHTTHTMYYYYTLSPVHSTSPSRQNISWVSPLLLA